MFAQRLPNPQFAAAAMLCALALAIAVPAGICAQSAAAPPVESGMITIAGRQVTYRMRNLPVSSFPELPEAVANALEARGCVIPQTYQAHHPENVIHGSFEKPDSSDWAVLCSAQGMVSLLVFFADGANGAAAKPAVVASGPKADHLQRHDPSGELGFDWGIDPAAPKRVHEAQAGMPNRPPMLDHDCVADTVIDQKTVYHFYKNGAWVKVDTP